MKLLFIHDHPFFKESTAVYSGGGLPARVWVNYLSSFDNIEVIGRQSNNIKDKKVLSSGDARVSFCLIQEYSSLKNLLFNFKKIKEQIEKQILLLDLTIIRLPSILGFIAGYIVIRNKLPFVIEQVGNAKEAMVSHESSLGKISAPILHYFNRKIVSKSRYVIYVTEKKLQKDYPTKGKTAVISNVIIPKVLSLSSWESSRFTNKIFKIALIGGFDTRYKGQDILLKSVALLPKEIRTDIELFFIGKGDYSWITEMAKDLSVLNNIKFIGGLEAGNKIFDVLNDMTLYTQPSLTEGMPRGMLEAMSVGCPVLASSVGGIPDLIDESWLHKAKDFKKLSDQIQTFYLDRTLLIKESQKNLQKILPYLKDNLERKRKDFFELIINGMTK